MSSATQTPPGQAGVTNYAVTFGNLPFIMVTSGVEGKQRTSVWGNYNLPVVVEDGI